MPDGVYVLNVKI